MPMAGNPTTGLICAACGQQIACGYAFVNVAAAWMRAQAYSQWVAAQRYFGRPVTSPPPERIAWRWVHPGCHVDPDYPRLYVIGVERLRSDRQLLDLVLRLSAEKWFPQTAWQSTLIRPILDAR